MHPVRAAREAQGLSRESLAGRAGVSLKTIEQIERGTTEPRRATKRVIALVLDADVDALFGKLAA